MQARIADGRLRTQKWKRPRMGARAVLVAWTLALVLARSPGQTETARLRDFLQHHAVHEGLASASRTWAATAYGDGVRWTEVGPEVSEAWTTRWETTREREAYRPGQPKGTTVALSNKGGHRWGRGKPRTPGFGKDEHASETTAIPSFFYDGINGPCAREGASISSLREACPREETEANAQRPAKENLAAGPQLLDVMQQKSIFVAVRPATASMHDTVIERFHNGHSWVFVRHYMSETTDATQVFTWQNRVYVITSRGDLVERRRTRDERLEWYQMRGLDLSGAVSVSTRRRSTSAFFLNREGRILERKGSPPPLGKEVPDGGSEDEFFSWIAYKSEFNTGRASAERLVSIVDAEGLEPGTLLFVSESGYLLRGLLQFRSRVISLDFIGAPRNFRLLDSPGVLSYGKLFLTTVSGDLAQLSLNGSVESSINWHVYEKARSSMALSGALGPVLALGRAIVAVNRNGELVVVEIGASLTQWWSRGMPVDPTTGEGVPLRWMSPRQVNADMLVAYTVDDRMALFRHETGKWVWSLVDLPELSSEAEYCIGDRNQPNSCMPVDLDAMTQEE